MSSLDPAAPRAGSNPPRSHRRENVFCHECHREWYRDQHGLVCPNESCRSDFVEIVSPSRQSRPVSSRPISFLTPTQIENSNDLREALDDYDDFDERDHMHGRPHTFPPFAPSPGGTTIFRAEGPGFSYVSTRTISPPRGVRTPIAPEDEMIADLFSTMIRNIVGDQHMQTRNREGGPDGASAGGQAGASGSPQPAGRPQVNPFSMFGGGPRLNPRDADSPQAGEAPQVLDVAT
jgi:E3 ubiquitin-protein ligase RNF115/126